MGKYSYDTVLMSTTNARKIPNNPGLTQRGKARRAAILSASYELIGTHGFDGASLESICEKAACSKSAVYELFGNKQGILAALSEEIALDLSRALHAFHIQNLSVRIALQRYATMVMERVLADSYIGIIRAIISVSGRYPEIGPAYYHVGAGAARSALASYLQSQHDAGALEVPNTQLSADEFQGLLLWDRMLAQLVGARPQPTEAQIQEHIQSVVDLFVSRHAVNQ